MPRNKLFIGSICFIKIISIFNEVIHYIVAEICKIIEEMIEGEIFDTSESEDISHPSEDTRANLVSNSQRKIPSETIQPSHDNSSNKESQSGNTGSGIAHYQSSDLRSTSSEECILFPRSTNTVRRKKSGMMLYRQAKQVSSESENKVQTTSGYNSDAMRNAAGPSKAACNQTFTQHLVGSQNRAHKGALDPFNNFSLEDRNEMAVRRKCIKNERRKRSQNVYVDNKPITSTTRNEQNVSLDDIPKTAVQIKTNLVTHDCGEELLMFERSSSECRDQLSPPFISLKRLENNPVAFADINGILADNEADHGKIQRKGDTLFNDREKHSSRIEDIIKILKASISEIQEVKKVSPIHSSQEIKSKQTLSSPLRECSQQITTTEKTKSSKLTNSRIKTYSKSDSHKGNDTSVSSDKMAAVTTNGYTKVVVSETSKGKNSCEVLDNFGKPISEIDASECHFNIPQEIPSEHYNSNCTLKASTVKENVHNPKLDRNKESSLQFSNQKADKSILEDFKVENIDDFAIESILEDFKVENIDDFAIESILEDSKVESILEEMDSIFEAIEVDIILEVIEPKSIRKTIEHENSDVHKIEKAINDFSILQPSSSFVEESDCVSPVRQRDSVHPRISFVDSETSAIEISLQGDCKPKKKKRSKKKKEI